MNLSIRQADVSDKNIICALGVTTFCEAYFEQDESSDLANYVLESFSPAQIEAELNDTDSTFFIAELNGKAVGYAKLRENSTVDCLKNKNAVELHRIYILERAKGKGVGGELMNRCLETARAKGYETIWLGVWEENPAARKFYEKLGFVKVGELQFPYGKTVGTNAVMKMEL
ncbi:MAG: GNAT family N-acetyltransferase [Acidobacteria bacterium]|nr:GNAT family N-acetyltransferase [Acidobacteriota bacterium]MCA1639943.1 GNAT family N-acetyltransferase [Acidobacteriota bacterium]